MLEAITIVTDIAEYASEFMLEEEEEEEEDGDDGDGTIPYWPSMEKGSGEDDGEEEP